MNYLEVISRHTRDEHEHTVPAFIIHSALVTNKALEIARDYLQRNPDAKIDLRFLVEASMLHDIGIFRVDEPRLHTKGALPYIAHAQTGYELLLEEGLPRHALVARNHVAITASEVREQGLPLPEEDHLPTTPEEELVFVADQFYSKVFGDLFAERSLDEVRAYLDRLGKRGHFDELWAKYTA
jgi:uncharacterized protein